MRGLLFACCALVCSFIAIVGCLPQAVPIEKQLDVVYKSIDGLDLHLDYMAPKGPGPFPIVVSIHGGGWQRGSYKEYTAFQENCAKSGIATISVQYRFAPKAKFPAQQEDVQDALKFILKDKKKYPIDSDRVAWLGGSAGAHLALLAGFSPSDQYKSLLIVNVAGPTNMKSFKSWDSGDKALKGAVGRDSAGLLEDLLGTTDKTADVYRTASPIEIVAAGAPRVFTVHGEKDDIVPITQAEELHARLKELGIPENIYRSKEGTHNFATWPVKDRNEALLEMVKEINSVLLKK